MAGSAGSSNSDIPTMDDNTTHVSGVRRVKRKGREDDITTMFEQFTADISSKLNQFNANLCSKVSCIQEDINTVIKKELEVIQSDIKTIDAKQSQLYTEINDMKESLNFFDKEQKDLQLQVKSIESNSNNNTENCSWLKLEVAKLQSELNSLHQRERSENLEIIGVPDKPNENLVTYMISLAQCVGVQLSSTDIIHVVRIQPYTKISGRPKIIIMKLRSVALRDSILSGIRTKKGVTTLDIGMPGEERKIFVNEHLTPVNKLLYKNTREKSKEKNYQFTWVRNGRIFVRKDDVSPKLLIKDCADLKKII